MSCLFKKPEIILPNDDTEHKGYITTFGRLAVTISSDGYEWYAPFSELANSVMEKINNKRINIHVLFKIDRSKTYGKTLKGHRFYAMDVKDFPVKYLKNECKIVNSIVI